MNLAKLLTPDFFIGKILVAAKTLVDTTWLIVKHPSSESLRFAWLVIRIKPKFTMVKTRNLKILYDLVCELERLQLKGDIVECGVWNGGSAAIMGIASMECVKSGLRYSERTLWLFDSFQGLPHPGDNDGEFERRNYFAGWCRGDVGLVKEALRMVRADFDTVRIIPGWFNETLPDAPVEKIALLHIDADWYDSVKLVLKTFYDRVTPGGFIVLDDYGYWEGCNRAVSDFFTEREINGITIKTIGRQGAYFMKPSEK